MMTTEKRLIDASALIDEIDGIYQRHYVKSSYQFIHDFFRAVFRRIHKAPTVDAVEVVRCKDCIHYDFSVCLKIYSDGAVSQYAWQARKEDDFCSYGERRSENDSVLGSS